jgi:putative resolvase
VVRWLTAALMTTPRRRRQQAVGDLNRQVARLREYGGDGPAVFTDVASGLSDHRAGLGESLAGCMTPGVDRLLVGHPDRLAGLGVGLIEQLLRGCGVTVVYTGHPEDESELVRDMLAIVTGFAGRLCGRRSAKTKRLRAALAADSGDAP